MKTEQLQVRIHPITRSFFKDDFAYNPARINVGSIARLKSFDKGIVSPMYICFKVTDGIVPEYLESYFATNHFSKEMQKRFRGQCASLSLI